MSELPKSTFLEFTSHGTTEATTVADAYGLPYPPTAATSTVNAALVLARANDPAELLAGNWGARQAALAELGNDLWTTYGASPADYETVTDGLAAMGIPTIGDAAGSGGYVSSQESRTIWVSLTPENFEALFDTQPFQDESSYLGDTLYYWEGKLSLPDGWNVSGLWFDISPIWGTYPAVSDLSQGRVADPPQGPQSIGNELTELGTQANNFSGDIAAWFYDFPLTGTGVDTATVGLVEPGIADQLGPHSPPTFQKGLDDFRAKAGIVTPGSYYSVANNGLSFAIGNAPERSLDIGVVTSANPHSTLGLYGGSGFGNNAQSNAYTAYQAAFWDQVNAPPVVTSSFGIFQQAAPDSPFGTAVRELFVDGALANISTFIANNDWGSSYNFANGIANQNSILSSPYAVLVGGTSLTTLATAPLDSSLSATPSPADSLYGLAMAGDSDLLWRLAAGGLTMLPSSAASGAAAAEIALLESVWNVYALRDRSLYPGFIELTAGGASDGGVDSTQPTPWYQTAFGLTPTSVNPEGGTGRGAPDVSALAGGNMLFNGPPPNMSHGLWNYWGTSAATPLWASLAAQIDSIFTDQGLPQLGYMNDLLYTAAAVAPAAFNDITFGNNVSSYVIGGPIDSNGTGVTLTGYGYEAGEGYDLTTGLGSPNGLLLARALSAIAHQQTSFQASPHILVSSGSGDWTAPVVQTLLLQTTFSSTTTFDVSIGSDSLDFSSWASAQFSWTSRFAQQTLQPDFDPNLVWLFDKQALGMTTQAAIAPGDALTVSINGSAADAAQGMLTSSHGFIDFATADGAIRVARPVAVAETAGALDDQQAVVRLRQNGQDSLSLTLYRVDDYNGNIGELAPGDPGYAAAVAGRAFSTTTGATSIDGPGYGNFSQVLIDDVDAGDLIAMVLVNQTSNSTFFAFSQGNETVGAAPVGHLWNYGLNTFGWEDLYGGGDRDFNDLIVGLDFTSASGSGWLISG